MNKHPAYFNRILSSVLQSGGMVLKKQLIAQVAKFGVVGVSAAIVHFSVVVLLVQHANWHPLQANMLGYCVAFNISYWGHRLWTFNARAVLHRQAFPKLLTVQTSNFIANQLLFYTFLQMHLPYKLALLIVLTILPIFTFILNKFWVFNEGAPR